MTTTRGEHVPALWDDARDLPFFRITDRLFSPEFCFGAGVLLASYDDTPGTAAAARRTVAATTAGTDTGTQSAPGFAPARVRRPR